MKKVSVEQSSWTNEIIKEDLMKIAKKHYERYYYIEEYREDIEKAIERDVQLAMNKCIDLHDWEIYVVIPNADEF